jgi:hypothetical protein
VLKEALVFFAEDFETSPSAISFEGLETIQTALGGDPHPIVVIGNHPVLGSILADQFSSGQDSRHLSKLPNILKFS